jgi:hypothetical protein
MANKPADQTPATPVVEPAAAAPTPTPKPDITDVMAQDNAVAKLLSTPTKKKPAAKVEPAAEPATPAVEPVKPAEPVAAAPATPEPAPEPKPLKVRRPQPQKPAMDAQVIADAVAAGVSKVLPKPAEPVAPVVELPEHLAANRPVYEQLEALNPRYKGIAAKMASFAQKEMDYATQWEDRERSRLIGEGKAAEANDVAFDASDPQHSSFYKRNAPDIDPRDMKRAELRAELAEMKKSEGDKPDEVAGLRKEIANLKAEPEARRSVDNFSSGLISMLNPDGGELTPQKFQQWAEANPIEAEVAQQLQQHVTPVVHAASLLWDGAVDFDQKNESHTVAANTFNQFETQLSAAGENAVDEKGRQWIPLAEYNKLTTAQRRDYSTTTKEKLIAYISLNAAQQVKSVAKTQREIIERNATRLGYQKPQASPVTPQAPAATPSKPAPALVSPSVSSAAPTPPIAGAAPVPVVENTSHIARMLGSR